MERERKNALKIETPFPLPTGIMVFAKPAVIPSELASTPDAPLSSLSVQLDLSKAAETYSPQIDSISANFRAASYLAAAQIFLKSNATLERELVAEDVKERLLGHWVCAISAQIQLATDDSGFRELLEESTSFIPISTHLSLETRNVSRPTKKASSSCADLVTAPLLSSQSQSL